MQCRACGAIFNCMLEYKIHFPKRHKAKKVQNKKALIQNAIVLEEKSEKKIFAAWIYKGKIQKNVHVKLFEHDKPQILEDKADLAQFLQWIEIQRSSHSLPAQ